MLMHAPDSHATSPTAHLSPVHQWPPWPSPQIVKTRIGGPPCRHLRADISVQTPPRKHLRVDTSVQAPPCRHLRAETSAQTSPRSTSVQKPPCRHLRADTSVQTFRCKKPPCRHFRIVKTRIGGQMPPLTVNCRLLARHLPPWPSCSHSCQIGRKKSRQCLSLGDEPGLFEAWACCIALGMGPVLFVAMAITPPAPSP